LTQQESNRWPAPAKLNLMLRIVGRRGDGYHLLQTVFQFLDYSDHLYFHRRRDAVIRRCNPVPGLPQEQDLTVRAARLLQRESGASQGVDIELHKRLPMGAGLGGGSSDAATTLVALNRLWNCRFSVSQLAGIGLSLGADVPVFVSGQAAWGEGVGERLTPLELPEPWYLVLVPPCHVATADIFSAPDLTRDSGRIKIRDFLAGSVENDCRSVVCRRYPQVADTLQWLEGFAEARLTGTGAAVFAEFRSKQAAEQVKAQAPGGCRAFVARGLNRSPLQGLVAD
jgi:4-diphosphocytidyl-2-C-methyl-D-erythritol kinase